MKTKTLWVKSGHFTAVAEFQECNGKWVCFCCAPILHRHMMARELQDCLDTCYQKGWGYEELNHNDAEDLRSPVDPQ